MNSKQMMKLSRCYLLLGVFFACIEIGALLFGVDINNGVGAIALVVLCSVILNVGSSIIGVLEDKLK